MIGLIRTRRLRRTTQTLVPFTLAAIVAVIGAFVYLELVSALIAYVG